MHLLPQKKKKKLKKVRKKGDFGKVPLLKSVAKKIFAVLRNVTYSYINVAHMC